MDVTVHNAAGNPFSVKIIVSLVKAQYQIVDGEYLGISAVSYVAKDFQKKFEAAAAKDPKKPVSAVIHDLTSDPNFVKCP